MKSRIKQTLRYLEYHILWPAVFRCASLRKPDPKTVLFADPYSRTLTDNMRPLFDALAQDGRVKLKTAFAEAPAPGESGLQKRLREERQHLKFLIKYATAGTLILTESYLPAYAVKRRKGQEVFQLWHACGAFKKWGYSILDNSFGASRKTMKQFPMHNCYTLVTVSSRDIIPAYADAFHCDPALIEPLGVPRTDVFFEPDFAARGKEALFQSYDGTHPGQRPLKEQLGSRKILLYAPTFRGNNIVEAHFDTPLDLARLKAKFGNEYAFLYKLHPYAKDGFKVPDSCKDFAFNVTDCTANDALAAADVLLTDYSSILFEYSLLDRPMVFYAYDLESYIDERNFYTPYEDLVPGPIAKTQDELESALADPAAFGPDRLRDFRNTYMSACDGRATERLVQRILNRL